VRVETRASLVRFRRRRARARVTASASSVESTMMVLRPIRRRRVFVDAEGFDARSS
jgi:hypothetical protein